MPKKQSSSDLLITTIISGIEDVKGKEITILDLREIENTVCTVSYTHLTLPTKA